MPQITLTTNLEKSTEEGAAIRRKLSKSLSLWLGKPESYCMVITHFGVGMTFDGSEAPAASADISSLGLPEEDLPELTQSVCSFLHTHLRIDPSRAYVRFTVPPRTHWGWNGKTFG